MLLTLVLLLSLAVHAESSFEYVSPDQKAQLEKDFREGSLSPTQQSELLQKTWSCDMYGMRTRLQIQRGLKLYQLVDDKSGVKNNGVQLIAHYNKESGQLIGRDGRFEDQIKMTARGQLISRLSLSAGSHDVLAYSLCKAM